MILLRIKRKDGKYDIVNGATLNQLISAGKIIAFYRFINKKWCVIGEGTVRTIGKPDLYFGMERRQGLR